MSGIGISRSENFRPLHEAIGIVAANAAHASHAMLQLAEVVSGSSLIYFPLQEGTLGTQISAVKTAIEHTNRNPHIRHAPIADEHKRAALRLLRGLDALVRYRNRVLHDTWIPVHHDKIDDAIEGHRATAFSKETVHSSIGSFRLLGGVMFGFAAGCTDLEQSIWQWRRTNVVESTPAGEAVRRLEHAIDSMKSGTLNGWKWETIQTGR